MMVTEPALPSRTRSAVRVGTAVSNLSRHLHRGSGSVIGGRAILAIDPTALERLAHGRPVALVSGTNGKTTTTSLLRAALATAGPVVTNALGANLPPGLTSALATAEPDARAVLEVDEAWLGRVSAATSPVVVALLNLSRDQLDRNNEVRRLSAAWRQVLAEDTPSRPAHVVANADDPLVAWAASASPSVTWVGAGQPWTADAAGCPNCGSRITFAADTASRTVTEPWSCSGCELRRPDLDLWLEESEAVSRDGDRWPLRLNLPGRANRANALMAMASARAFGVLPARAFEAMARMSEVAGRYRTETVGGCRARMLLAKNPAGWLEVFDLLQPPPVPVVVAINARIADGKDPSWLWDVPFERLKGRLVVATGERNRDLAVRLHYAEVEHKREPDLVASITAASAPEVDVVANYTSFQQLATRLSRGR